MTDGLRVRVTGDGDRQAAADALRTCFGDDSAVAIEPPRASDLPHRAVDPIAVAALIISIPGALLAVADLVERMRSRRKAAELIETAREVTVKHHVEIHVIADDGAISLPRLSPDRLLDLARPTSPPKPSPPE